METTQNLFLLHAREQICFVEFEEVLKQFFQRFKFNAQDSRDYWATKWDLHDVGKV